MSKHTQGPWTVVRDADPDAVTYVEAADQTVCALTFDGTDRADDARLIAAAPGLYACLRNLYERGLIGGTDTDTLDEVKDVLFAADADFNPYEGD